MKNKNKRFGTEVSSTTAPFSVRSTQQISNHYICDVWDSLENLSDVEDTLFVLGVAEENDTVTIQLNSDGGAHHVGDALLMAMRKCKAPIHVVASGRVASYATFILLQCDSFEISPFCEILCHSPSFGSGGKMADTLQATEFTYKLCEKILNTYYEGFLSKEEINRIVTQKYEHLMDSDEFVERFQRVVEYQMEKAQQECTCPHCGECEGEFCEEPFDDDEDTQTVH